MVNITLRIRNGIEKKKYSLYYDHSIETDRFLPRRGVKSHKDRIQSNRIQSNLIESNPTESNRVRSDPIETIEQIGA